MSWVKTAKVRKIANKFWKEIGKLKKHDIFELCEQLFLSDYCEEAFIVSFWLPKIADKFESDDWMYLKTGLKNM